LIHSDLVGEGGKTVYRTWGGRVPEVGNWLSPEAPVSSRAAIRDLALWPENTAEFVSSVQIPAGTRIQSGTAAAAFGRPGGGSQIELLKNLPDKNYGPAKPLPPE
jgi:hypothetical protein